MLSLGVGRVLSMLIGYPTGGYAFGVIEEIILGLYLIYQLKKYVTD